jgi:hypothetical protein
MKTAKDYPVTFPYGATTSPYNINNPHKGEDRKMPLGTPVVVNGLLIGYAGTTGNSTGVHTHTQKVVGDRVVHPQGGGYDVPLPVKIIATGYRSDIGNYVRYIDATGVIWSVFHLEQIKCKVGDIIMKPVTIENNALWFGRMNKLTEQIRGRFLTQFEFEKNFVGQDPFRMTEVLSDHIEADKALQWQNLGKKLDGKVIKLTTGIYEV